jgi:uncharacterized protein YjiS (DUF1127 family)
MTVHVNTPTVAMNGRAKGLRVSAEVRGESIMITLNMISEKFNAWRRRREAVRELSQFSDHELCDIGIRRCDIEDIVRRTGPRKQDV